MRKSVSLAEEGSVSVAREGENHHSLDTSCQVHKCKARNGLGSSSMRARQKKSSVSSFGTNQNSSKERDSAERRKKFSLCTGSSYDSQLSLGVDQLQLQGAASRPRKLSLVSLTTSNQSSSQVLPVKSIKSSSLLFVVSHTTSSSLPFSQVQQSFFHSQKVHFVSW